MWQVSIAASGAIGSPSWGRSVVELQAHQCQIGCSGAQLLLLLTAHVPKQQWRLQSFGFSLNPFSSKSASPLHDALSPATASNVLELEA